MSARDNIIAGLYAHVREENHNYNKGWSLYMDKIEWVTRVFTQSALVQKSLFPDFSNVADELAVEWEFALEDINIDLLNNEQKSSIKALDDYMLSISGSENVRYWNDDALCNSDEWNKMRSLASVILATMGWDDIPPNIQGAIYVKKQ